MNKTRFRFLMAAVAFLLTTGGLSAQTSIQKITISLLGDYQRNFYFTNTSNASEPLTNYNSRVYEVLVSTPNVIRSIATDLLGTQWAQWSGADMVREVNLTNGNEGIFLRKNGQQVNVSSYFAGSFSNNFTGQLTNAFPGVNSSNLTTVTFSTNGVTDFVSYLDTNDVTNLEASIVTNGITNTFTNGVTNIFNNYFDVQTPLVQGVALQTNPSAPPTNYVKSYNVYFKTAGVYFIALNTTNVKFNVVGAGEGYITTLAGTLNGIAYQRQVGAEIIGTAGAFYLNATSNVYNLGTNLPAYYAGPTRGTVILQAPYIINVTNGP
jgi:hypothetical protein